MCIVSLGSGEGLEELEQVVDELHDKDELYSPHRRLHPDVHRVQIGKLGLGSEVEEGYPRLEDLVVPALRDVLVEGPEFAIRRVLVGRVQHLVCCV